MFLPPDSDAEVEDDNYEDNEAWKKHLPKFQRGMCCEDHVDCDRHNVSLLISYLVSGLKGFPWMD